MSDVGDLFGDVDQPYSQPEGASSGAAFDGAPQGGEQPGYSGGVPAPGPDAMSDMGTSHADPPLFGAAASPDSFATHPFAASPRPCGHCFPCHCDLEGLGFNPYLRGLLPWPW
jgi:hypothetical protein